ncbi:MAG: hypothetical protein M3O46_17650 [Myxococcota bacterium]|nr:hypothetical protein [Myxococcota bacterium]
MRKTVAGVLARFDDEHLAFLDQALGELCEAAKVVIASMHAKDQARALTVTGRMAVVENPAAAAAHSSLTQDPEWPSVLLPPGQPVEHQLNVGPRRKQR